MNKVERNIFEENPILLISEIRIKKEERQKELHYYSIRSSEDGFDPLTIEKSVWANHMFDLALEKPIEVKDFLELTEVEREMIFDAFYAG